LIHPGGGARRSQDGFTLVEVLMAMVILSVGLLSMMPLGATELKLVAAADQRTELTVNAASHLERAVLDLRRAGALTDSSWTLSGGEKVVRTAARTPSTKVWTLTVQVTPTRADASSHAVTLTNHVFLP
jgi:prepilin-type N-terminal cleavage/methylation domain-containing protein